MKRQARPLRRPERHARRAAERKRRRELAAHSPPPAPQSIEFRAPETPEAVVADTRKPPRLTVRQVLRMLALLGG